MLSEEIANFSSKGSEYLGPWIGIPLGLFGDVDDGDRSERCRSAGGNT